MMANVRKGKVTKAVCELRARYGMRRMRFLNHVYDMEPGRFGINSSTRLTKEIRKAEMVSKVAIFTNTPNIWARRVVSRLGLDGTIKPGKLVTLERLDNASYFKPSRRAFLKLFKVLRTRPGRIIFLDDSKDNIDEARKLGVESVLICNDGRCRLEGHSSSRTIYEELGTIANSDK